MCVCVYMCVVSACARACVLVNEQPRRPHIRVTESYGFGVKCYGFAKLRKVTVLGSEVTLLGSNVTGLVCGCVCGNTKIVHKK